VLHFRKSAIITYPAAIAALDPILTTHLTVNAGGGGVAWRTHATTTDSLTAIRYTPLDGISATTVTTHVFAGLSANPLPAQNALVATLRTANRGRSYRGRVYESAHNEGDNQGVGAPSALLVAGVATQWNALLTALVGSGVSLVVASYHLVLATNVTAVSVDGRWDTQRRRLN